MIHFYYFLNLTMSMYRIGFNIKESSDSLSDVLKWSMILPVEYSKNNNKKIISISIKNQKIPLPDNVNKHFSYIPNSKNIRGTIGKFYITQYFNRNIIIVTDVEKCTTFGYILDKHINKNTLYFLNSLIKPHIYHHFFYNKMLIIHAGVIADKNDNAILISGNFRAGKTTFVINAVKSGKYRLLCDDRIIYDELTKKLYGNPLRIFALQSTINKYPDLLKFHRPVAEGKERRYLVNTNNWPISYQGNLELCIFLNADKTKPHEIYKLSQEKIENFLISDQKRCYLPDNTEKLNKLINLVSKMPCYYLNRQINKNTFLEFIDFLKN